MIRSICDLSDDHPALARAVEPVFRDFGGIRVFHGRITTLRCREDNMLLRRTLATPGEGRVMVVDGGGSLRHVENLRDMPVAVRALGVCPTRPGQQGDGELDVVVQFAGAVFRPGEWLYADENGIIVSAEALA
jgi:regulator of ribonuclease activity A